MPEDVHISKPYTDRRTGIQVGRGEGGLPWCWWCPQYVGSRPGAPSLPFLSHTSPAHPFPFPPRPPHYFLTLHLATSTIFSRWPLEVRFLSYNFSCAFHRFLSTTPSRSSSLYLTPFTFPVQIPSSTASYPFLLHFTFLFILFLFVFPFNEVYY